MRCMMNELDKTLAATESIHLSYLTHHRLLYPVFVVQYYCRKLWARVVERSGAERRRISTFESASFFFYKNANLIGKNRIYFFFFDL